MQEVPGEFNSETEVRPVHDLGRTSLYQLIPITGRKHQLRLHLAGLGIPIINDRLYPVTRPADPENFSSPLKLLAKSLSFQDPISGRQLYFESGMKL